MIIMMTIMVHDTKCRIYTWASQVALVVKNLPANEGGARDVGLTPGLGKSLQKDMETYSNIQAWGIPWTGEPGGLQSIGSQRLEYD